jgi:hypothetical protein
MDLQDLIDLVGQPLFEEVQRYSWETAAGAGGRRNHQEADFDEDSGLVQHELASEIWESGDDAAVDRVALSFELYRAMPCYASMIYVRMNRGTWDEDAHRLFWDECRTLVDDEDDHLADPVTYSLWCDWFEDPETVEEAWSEIARPKELSERGLERLLDCAGPVPFELKAPLYNQLAQDPRWHVPVFRSLLYSGFDYYGQIDIDAARELLRRLDVPADTEGLGDLERLLKVR